jgi:hypothetical protein
MVEAPEQVAPLFARAKCHDRELNNPKTSLEAAKNFRFIKKE